MKTLIQKGLKVGDQVECTENGKGIVTSIKSGAYLYPIMCLFINDNEQCYTIWGELAYGSMVTNLSKI